MTAAEDGGAAVIRPMDAKDVAAVAAIERESFSTPWEQETFTEMLTWTDRSRAWVLELEASRDRRPEVIGYAILRFVQAEGELVNIAIREDVRGRGRGSQLLDGVLDRARVMGIKHLFLEVRRSNVRAQEMYEARGFQVVGIRRAYYTRPVEDAKIMLLTLEVTHPEKV